jgi:hypothetical protein
MIDIHHNQAKDSMQKWRSTDDRHNFLFTDRVAYLAVISISAITIGISRLLEPAPPGLGTHEQLGLPPCPFFHFTGIPCPGCGLTTSFAHAARLNIYEAFVTQPFGVILFFIIILSIPLSLILFRRRINISHVLQRISAKITYSFIVLCLISWIYKIIVMR